MNESEMPPLTLNFLQQFNILLRILGTIFPTGDLLKDPTGGLPFPRALHLAPFEKFMDPPHGLHCKYSHRPYFLGGLNRHVLSSETAHATSYKLTHITQLKNSSLSLYPLSVIICPTVTDKFVPRPLSGTQYSRLSRLGLNTSRSCISADTQNTSNTVGHYGHKIVRTNKTKLKYNIKTKFRFQSTKLFFFQPSHNT